MRAKLARLQLKDYRYHKIIIDANDNFVEESDLPDIIEFIPDIDVRGQNEGSDEFVVFLSVLVTDDNVKNYSVSPYHIQIEISGYFALPGMEDERSDDSDFVGLKYLNAPAILYGLCREKVNELTSTSIFGTVLLPSINLMETFESYRSEKQDDGQNTK